MKRIYGFMVDDGYVSNTHNEISSIGEISSFSKTFSLDIRHYQSLDHPNKDLMVMKSVDETNGTEFVLSVDQVSVSMAVYERVKAFAASNSLPYNLNDYKTYLYAHFPNIIDLVLGDIVEHTNIGLPSFISFYYSGDYYHIWFSDLAFRNQYPFYEIKIIPPVNNIDIFFTSPDYIHPELDKRTSEILNQEIENNKNKEPYSYIRFLDFDYVYPPNPALRIKTTWIVLIHGRIGDYVDNIKDALIDYILRNSPFGESDWRVRFPDIFARTEFVLVPRWDKMAVENMDLLSGIYRSMFSLNEMQTFVSEMIDFYQQGHVLTNTIIFPHDYKSLMIGIIRGPENRDGDNNIIEMFKDYIPVNTASLDFNRMKMHTKNWMLKLQEILMVAETATSHSIITVPDARRTYRHDKLFITFMYDNVNYLIAARSNVHYSNS